MGREIRRVPEGWEHPKDAGGSYKPLHNKSYDEAAKRWVVDCAAWDNGTHEDLVECLSRKDSVPYYWEWAGMPPDEELCRPAFESEPIHYQIYENVSEGTPVSPVFATLQEMEDWLVGEGYSSVAAKAFCKSGYALSMTVCDGEVRIGIHTLED